MKIEFDNDELVFVGRTLNSLITNIDPNLLKSISELDCVSLLESESVLDFDGINIYFHNDGSVIMEFSDKFKSFIKEFTDQSLIPICSYITKARSILNNGIHDTIMRPIFIDCYLEEEPV